MATNFSPCKGSYVLNQFPSNVMFGMNGFHGSASGAIQGHHGPLVSFFSDCPLFTFKLDFCLVHMSKTIIAMVMKFCGWIDLIKGKCSAHEL